jgi:mannose-6-phosphate isomerase class I
MTNLITFFLLSSVTIRSFIKGDAIFETRLSSENVLRKNLIIRRRDNTQSVFYSKSKFDIFLFACTRKGLKILSNGARCSIPKCCCY